mmetsp:Transcript_24057/g.50335  ORF Transcript_24057/g.50335 Transcript_24057/m.50335 type:complete len:329 (+) Transcript_24057:24-1010(+)
MENLPAAIRQMVDGAPASKRQKTESAGEGAFATPFGGPVSSFSAGPMASISQADAMATLLAMTNGGAGGMPGTAMAPTFPMSPHMTGLAAMAPSMPSTPMAAAPRPVHMSARAAAGPVPGVIAKPAVRAAVPADPRSPTEIKEELFRQGIDVKGLTSTREMQNKLHETEANVQRAEATKRLDRHPDQKLLSCFTEGLAPGQDAMLKMLEAGSDPNTVSEGSGSGFAVGMTPLLAAASWGKVDEVRLLIAAGADLRVRTPNMNQTAMHLVAGGNIESWGVEKTMGLLRLLVHKAPELLAEKNALGKTPLDCAKYEKKRQQAAYLASLPR